MPNCFVPFVVFILLWTVAGHCKVKSENMTMHDFEFDLYTPAAARGRGLMTS